MDFGRDPRPSLGDKGRTQAQTANNEIHTPHLPSSGFWNTGTCYAKGVHMTKGPVPDGRHLLTYTCSSIFITGGRNVLGVTLLQGT